MQTVLSDWAETICCGYWGASWRILETADGWNGAELLPQWGRYFDRNVAALQVAIKLIITILASVKVMKSEMHSIAAIQ